MNIQKEIYLIIIGTFIGSLFSIGTTIVAEIIKKKGHIKLYYKIVYSKVLDRGTWGFRNGPNGFIFEVPLWIEMQNTSNTVRIIRDLNILLFKDGKELTQMTQINKNSNESYGNEGAYSFVLQPRSLKKYDCHFIIEKRKMGENFEFDEIRLRYFDDKDKMHIFRLETIERCWYSGYLKRDGCWKRVKK